MTLAPPAAAQPRPEPDARRVALLSVSDKRGLEGLGAGLVAAGFDLVASGGTAHALRAAGLEVRDVADVTGAPEMLGGRVKTLHPAIAGGILARRDDADLAELDGHGIAPIDVVVCNLYPFVAALARDPDDEAALVEEIDIGGVTLLRAAAKNFASVAVVCEPEGYDALLEALAAGGPDLDARRRLAADAFAHTAAYDAAIAGYFSARVGADAADAAPARDARLPARLTLHAHAPTALRYGENPHQAAALYRLHGVDDAFTQLGGKALSFNNLVDLEAAWAMVQGAEAPTVAIVKHTNPCGYAVGRDAADAFECALACDPTSAFGSIIATNREVDVAFVEALGGLFVEVLAAPAFTPDAAQRLAQSKRNARLMAARPTAPPALDLRLLRGGLLVQTPDPMADDEAAFRVVSARAPTESERSDLLLAWRVAAHVKSNAIVLVRDGAAVGVGAGQMSRVDAVRLAAERAGERSAGAVLASDAFFPFADGLEAAAAAGVTAVVQPGGSVRDAEVIAACDALGLAMLMTGTRHFRH